MEEIEDQDGVTSDKEAARVNIPAQVQDEGSEQYQQIAAVIDQQN